MLSKQDKEDIKDISKVFSGEELYKMISNAGIEATKEEIEEIASSKAVAKEVKKSKSATKKIHDNALAAYTRLISEIRYLGYPETDKLFVKHTKTLKEII